MTARFAAATKRASPSDLSATTITTAETDLMSRWNVASGFILILIKTGRCARRGEIFDRMVVGWHVYCLMNA